MIWLFLCDLCGIHFVVVMNLFPIQIPMDWMEAKPKPKLQTPFVHTKPPNRFTAEWVVLLEVMNGAWLLVISPHCVKVLGALEGPGEAGGAVALDQVGVRLFVGAALPLLHHITAPAGTTLQGNTDGSYPSASSGVSFIHSFDNKHCDIVPHRQEEESAVCRAPGLEDEGDAGQLAAVAVFGDRLRKPVETSGFRLFQLENNRHSQTHLVCESRHRQRWPHLYPGTVSVSIR